MKRLTHNLGAKIMAIVLFVLLAALSAGSFVGIVLAWEENMYDRDNVTFEETSMCRSLVYSMADEIVDIYEWDSAQIPEMFSKENTNLSFRISETSAAERPAVQNYWIEGSAYADEIEWHYTLDVSETMDTTGAVTHTYVIQYALNEDMLAHDGFYWSYMLFELVYTMRYMICLLYTSRCV